MLFQVGAVTMARPGRPASEGYQPVCCSVSQSNSYSSESGAVAQEDEDDQAPIFSLSKSYMDVVMATGSPHKRDPTWTTMDLRRSSSTNTHTEQNSATLQKLRPHKWPHIRATNSLLLPLTAQNVGMHNPPAHSEHRIGNMQRWSTCSGSTHSRSSTPDTVIWKAGNSRPSSLVQDASCSATPESPLSKLASPPSTPSPFISPLYTPTLPPVDSLASASSQRLSTNNQEDLLVSSPGLSPMQTHAASPLPSISPDLSHQLTSTEDECFLENNLLSFQFPSPIPSTVSLAEGGVSSDHEGLVDDVTEQLPSPGDMQLSEGEAVRSPLQTFNYLAPNSAGEGQDLGEGESVCHLELPWQPGKSCLAGRGWKSPLVSSLSDSQLGECCRSKLHIREGIRKDPKAEVFREEGTMTSQLEMVDAAVQTVSPVGSWWDLRRNVSTSNMESHSILGSPPGSRLNLKSSVGSNSNLVSPSSSMFPVSSGEEEERQGDDPMWDINAASLHDLERKRSCLKMQGEEIDEMGRRSSMKQVQWDEEGVTWDVHGASVDPDVLSTAILQHLELQNSPQPPRKTTTKKKAPKPPLLSNVVKAIGPEINPPDTIVASTGVIEVTPEGDGERKIEEEGEDKKEEIVEAPRRISRAEEANAKEDKEEVYGEEATSHPKSPSRGSGQTRKRSVIRSLRPGWCGGSRKADD